MHPPDVRPGLRDEIVVGVGADDLALRVMLRDELGTTTAWAAWLMTGFFLVACVTVPLAGSLGDRIGRMTMTGSTSTLQSADVAGPASITAGPDGAMWITDDDYLVALVDGILAT